MNKKTIALVDDEVDFIEILKIVIADDESFANYEFKFYTYPSDCLKDLAEFDYLITDINMPGMDGFTLIKEAQKKRPELPTALMSAYPLQDYEAKVKDLKIKYYFEKPLNFKIIKEQLDEVYAGN